MKKFLVAAVAVNAAAGAQGQCVKYLVHAHNAAKKAARA